MSGRKQGLFGVLKEERLAVFFLFGLFFLIKASAAIFDNYVISLFLKRYGIRSLPAVYLINALFVFLFLSFLGRIVDRFNRRRFLMFLFMACALLMVGFRFLMMSGFSLSYPLMFFFSEQINALFSLSFWLLAGEIFSARQVKRVTPVLAAGGIMGTAFGSFAVSLLVSHFRIENISLFSVGLLSVGLLLLFFSRKLFASDSSTGFRKVASVEEKRITRFFKNSLLFRLLFVMIFIPGILLPLLDFQFNFLVDKIYKTEKGLLSFYGFFKGGFSLIMFFLHLFVTGKLFLRLGLPRLVRFLPFSYFFYFTGVSAFFKLPAAIAGKILTKVVINTIHNPAKKNLLTFFPEDVRGKIAFFMKGAASKLGKVAGSGLLFLSLPILSVRDLSFVGIFIAVIGIIAARIFAKNYTPIVMRSVASRQINLDELGGRDIVEIVTPEVHEQLCGYLHSGNETLTMIAVRFFINSPESSSQQRLLKAFPNLPKRTQQRVIEMLELSGTNEMIGDFGAIVGSFAHPLFPYYVRLLAVRRYPESQEMIGQLLDSKTPSFYIAGVVYALNYGDVALQEKGRAELSGLLEQEDSSSGMKAAIIRQLRNPSLASQLADYLYESKPQVRNAIIIALGNMRYRRAINSLRSMLLHPDPVVLRLSISALGKMWDMRAVDAILPFMADSRLSIKRAAIEAIRNCGGPVLPLLEKKISPQGNPYIVHAVLGILQQHQNVSVPHCALFRQFLERAFQVVYAYVLFEGKKERTAFRLVCKVLLEKFKQLRLVLVALLAFFDRQFKYLVVSRGLHSNDKHENALGLEAAESVCDPALFKPFALLFESVDMSVMARQGEVLFPLSKKTDKEVLLELIATGSFEERAAAINLIGSHGNMGFVPLLEKVLRLKDAEVCALAAEAVLKIKKGGRYMRQELSLIDKLLVLENAAIFAALSMREMTAIARITSELTVYSGEVIFEEGDAGDAMYLVVSGKVAITKMHQTQKVVIATLGASDAFGEMALFEKEARSAGAEAKEGTVLLKINGYEFEQIMHEYPAISINACKVFSKRLRSTTSSLAAG